MAKECNDNNDNFVDLIKQYSNKVDEVIGGDDITVQQVAEVDKNTWTVHYSPYIPLQVESFSQELGLQLKGTAVTSLLFNIVFNKAVQELRIQSSAFIEEVVVPITGSVTYTDIAVASDNLVGGEITDTTSFTVIADDITNDAVSSISASTSLNFGNKLYIGTLLNVDENTPSNTLVTLVQGLSSVVATSSDRTISCSGTTVSEYEIFASPVSFGAVTFKDSENPGPGGYYLINTIDIPNGNGFTESYYVYRSTYGNLNGAQFTTS